jgi:hypothetical protein
LTFTQNSEDYDYVHGTLDTVNIDVVGLSKTNSPWNNQHVTDGFNSAIRKYSSLNKIHVSSPIDKIDPLDSSITSQTGGMASTVYGGWTTSVLKSERRDPTGLG